MSRVPPVVRSRLTSGYAYLLGWHRLPVSEGGAWGARIAWLEQGEEGEWLVRTATVHKENVRPLEDQDYLQVPRDPRPSDPTDSRDPKARRGDRDKAYMERLVKASDPDGTYRAWMDKANGPY